MTNFEILTGLKSAYTKLCNSFNDPIQDDCTGCPFEVFGDGCPLQEAIGVMCDLDSTETGTLRYKLEQSEEKCRRLSDFIMSLDYMTRGNLTITSDDDGTWSFRRDEMEFHDAVQLVSAVERT